MRNQLKRVVVGLSGGVDSSVAAILLKEQGYEVLAAHMVVHPQGFESEQIAKEIACHLQIPFYSFDLIDSFEERVSLYLKNEYLLGKTPNPCVVCNKEIKFGIFLKRIEEKIGSFDFFATGHYALKEQLPNGRFTIFKGTDRQKDQAYFLARLTQPQIQKILFPLHGLQKSDVRAIAEKYQLPCAKSKESQDLCAGSYLQYIQQGSGEGPFIEKNTGKTVGIHKGIEHYTIGQRRGLNIGIGYPLFVTHIDQKKNIVYVDQEEALFAKQMVISHINWIGVFDPELPWKGEMKIRYRDSGTTASLLKVIKEADHYRGVIEFETPVRAITPGQLAVAYKQEGLAFSGFIEKTLPY